MAGKAWKVFGKKDSGGDDEDTVWPLHNPVIAVFSGRPIIWRVPHSVRTMHIQHYKRKKQAVTQTQILVHYSNLTQWAVSNVHIVALLVLRLLAHAHTHAQTLQMLQTQMKHKHTNKYKHNVLNVMFCGAQRAGCAHIESTYAACNSSYAHISQGRLSSHVVNIIFDKTITIL